jgi:trk system potassium uptake protein TrkH
MSAFLKWEKASITLSRRVLFRSPARFTIFGFAALIIVGTALLMMPAASAIGNLKFVDALFTAVSSSCVTGLIVVDTGSALSKFGQLVVLGLIQIGGLGIIYR